MVIETTMSKLARYDEGSMLAPVFSLTGKITSKVFQGKFSSFQMSPLIAIKRVSIRPSVIHKLNF